MRKGALPAVFAIHPPLTTRQAQPGHTIKKELDWWVSADLGAAWRGLDAERGTAVVAVPNDPWCWRCWCSPGQLVVVRPGDAALLGGLTGSRSSFTADAATNYDAHLCNACLAVGGRPQVAAVS